MRDGAREVQLVTAMSKQVGAKVSQRLTLTGGKERQLDVGRAARKRCKQTERPLVFESQRSLWRLVPGPGAWLQREWLR